jgi:quercetin dioxygenase-like cupin family protein
VPFLPGTLPAMGVVRRRGEGWTWAGVPARPYADGAERHVLVGGEDGARQIELRYFRIPPGGASARERHAHEHAVLILHGRAAVRLGGDVHEAGPGDAVFVAAHEEHELAALGDEPLGFLCAVAFRAREPGG